jgi:hypothetical protein
LALKDVELAVKCIIENGSGNTCKRIGPVLQFFA